LSLERTAVGIVIAKAFIDIIAAHSREHSASQLMG